MFRRAEQPSPSCHDLRRQPRPTGSRGVTRPARRAPELESRYRGFEKELLVPLWTEIGDLMPTHPRSHAVPHLWRWEKVIMGGRIPKPVGTFGKPTKPKRQRNGRWRTTVYYYGAAGRVQLERIGASADDASNRLAEAMRDHREQLGYGQITRTTKLIDLAAELLV